MLHPTASYRFKVACTASYRFKVACTASYRFKVACTASYRFKVACTASYRLKGRMYRLLPLQGRMYRLIPLQGRMYRLLPLQGRMYRCKLITSPLLPPAPFTAPPSPIDSSPFFPHSGLICFLFDSFSWFVLSANPVSHCKIIIITYIYHALIKALSAHIIYIHIFRVTLTQFRTGVGYFQ